MCRSTAGKGNHTIDTSPHASPLSPSCRRQITRALVEAGYETAADAIEATTLCAGTFASTYRVRLTGSDAVLKLYWLDIGRALSRHADPRLRRTCALLPVPPFFAATGSRTEEFRRIVDLAVPRVLAEGRLEGGPWFTLMEWLEGEPAAGAATGRGGLERLSAEIGGLVRDLHGAEPEPESAWGAPSEWCAALGEILHAIVDQLPPLVFGDRHGRARFHRRLEVLVHRLEDQDLGAIAHLHGDLHPSNLLLDARGAISGIVDFQLSFPGPAALELRVLPTLHGPSFFEALGVSNREWNDRSWTGFFGEMMWEGLAMASAIQFPGAVGPAFWTAYAAEWRYLLDLLEDEVLRHGPQAAREDRRRHHRRAVTRDLGRLDPFACAESS